MNASLRHPFVGHAAIVALFVVSVGVTRVAYIAPREHEAQNLRADGARLHAELEDVESGLREMDGWARAHPGQDLWSFHVRRALPSGEMTAAFLRAIVPIAERHHVATELIQPAGLPADVTVTDTAGNPITYRKAELRFRLIAEYQDLGEYLSEVETMDQLVVVRSVSLRQEGAKRPALAAEVLIWLYGTPEGPGR